MKNVYDMVSGQFIEDEVVPTQEVEFTFDYDYQHPALQLVEQQTSLKSISLPADLALQTFLMTK